VEKEFYNAVSYGLLRAQAASNHLECHRSPNMKHYNRYYYYYYSAQKKK
jgi:hypothetical protein